MRLCGSIPRKDMVVTRPGEGSSGGARGAPCLLRPVSQESLNGLVFASTNGPPPTLTKIAATATATPTNHPHRAPNSNSYTNSREDTTNTTPTPSADSGSSNPNGVFPSLSSNTTAMARGILTDRNQHQQQVFDLTSQQAGSGVVLEPPGWAVPASGESRLEVRRRPALGLWLASMRGFLSLCTHRTHPFCLF